MPGLVGLVPTARYQCDKVNLESQQRTDGGALMKTEDQNMEKTANSWNGFAVTGLVLGFSALVISIVAIVFSAISLAKVKDRGEKAKSRHRSN